MALKHVVIGGINENDFSVKEFKEWLEDSLEVSRNQEHCCSAKYMIIDDTVTIICCWTDKEEFKKFYDTNIDEMIGKMFEWHCQHHIGMDIKDCNKYKEG